MSTFTEWTPTDAAGCIAVPGEDDDKYSRGVLGVITGSDEYPGAAVLGVEAALHTGLGMVRYVGHERASDFVLARRPEVVVGTGRVQAWLIGSGTDYKNYTSADGEEALSQGLPTVLDAGALALHTRHSGPLVITPHYRELSRLIDVDAEQIAADPARWAVESSERLGATVLLKGHRTFVAGGGELLRVRNAPTWLATAGAGDALAGILGALVATHVDDIAKDDRMLPRLAATASVLHGLAADRAGGGGPFTILGLIEAIPATIAKLLRA